jgi:predicted dehydrogenase
MTGAGASQVRIGILGAARIAPAALVNPGKNNAEVVVAAVAARDASRARAFAKKHGIAKVHESYDALLTDPDIDAIYNPLPNGLHGQWTRAALAAGKHVLCEKPFTANAAEAREIAELAEESGRVVMEAFHYRYHPLTLRAEQIIASGVGGETPEVVWAHAKLHDPRIDRAMTAELRFPSGHTGRVRCSMWSSDLLRISARVIGERGQLHAINPVMPQLSHWFRVRSNGSTRTERFPHRASYAYQLDALAAAVLRGEPVKTPPKDSIENMTVIDAIYHAAGLPVRQPR